uniref:Uncharacterized protein n=1 Tax=Physcomitrium patens TaxID=3218 RepID=A0A2K1KV78_PHYPA|nr:hypothetical protein PHYPA_004644 [Physcomitrium patens]
MAKKKGRRRGRGGDTTTNSSGKGSLPSAPTTLAGCAAKEDHCRPTSEDSFQHTPPPGEGRRRRRRIVHSLPNSHAADDRNLLPCL